MKLTPRQLQTPKALASQRLPLVHSLCRIEASFRIGDLDQIEQWRQSGMLARAMRGELSPRKQLQHTIPLQWLQAAYNPVGKLYDASVPISNPVFQEVWDELRHFTIKAPTQQSLDEWLLVGASLHIAKDLVKEGANPHAMLASAPNRTPFSELLSNYLSTIQKKTHKGSGWPKLMDPKLEKRKRINEWMSMPGLSVDVATHCLNSVVRRALVENDPQEEAFLSQVRDVLIKRGALIGPAILDTLSDASHTKDQESKVHSYSPWPQQGLRSTPLKEESRQDTEARHEKLVRWANSLIGCPLLQAPSARWNQFGPWKNWLSMKGGSLFAAYLATNGVGPWKSNSPNHLDFFLNDDANTRHILLDETLAFDNHLTVAWGEGISQNWKTECAGSLIRRFECPFEQLKKIMIWTDPQTDKDIPDPITRSWFRAQHRFLSETNEVRDRLDIKTSVMWLYEQDKLNFMLYRPIDSEDADPKDFQSIAGSRQECFEFDLDYVSNEWSTWLKNKHLRDILVSLPSPFGERVRTLAPFFPAHEDDQEVRLLVIKDAFSINPYVKESLLSTLSDKLVRKYKPSEERLAAWHDFAHVNRMVREPKDSWRDLAIAFTPLVCGEFEQSEWFTILQDQVALAPCEEGPTLLLAGLLECARLRRQGENWELIYPLVHHAVKLGGKYENLDTSSDDILSNNIEALRQQSDLGKNTPIAQTSPRRPRI